MSAKLRFPMTGSRQEFRARCPQSPSRRARRALKRDGLRLSSRRASACCLRVIPRVKRSRACVSDNRYTLCADKALRVWIMRSASLSIGEFAVALAGKIHKPSTLSASFDRLTRRSLLRRNIVLAFRVGSDAGCDRAAPPDQHSVRRRIRSCAGRDWPCRRADRYKKKEQGGEPCSENCVDPIYPLIRSDLDWQADAACARRGSSRDLDHRA